MGDIGSGAVLRLGRGKSKVILQIEIEMPTGQLSREAEHASEYRLSGGQS